MVTLKFKKTIVQTIDKNVPDYYSSDDSPLGRAVDYLLQGYAHRGRDVRDRLWADDGDTVEGAIRSLDEAYETARGVAYALGVLNQVGGKVHNYHGMTAEDKWKRDHALKQ